MANLSEDIQCAGSDTRPPMVDRTDFALWQQRIRLYCRGKENGVNILKSINDGPFQMGTIRDTLAEGTEGAHQLGPERARVYSDLSPEDKDRMQLNSKFVNNMLPEWGRFVTAMKRNRGLRDSNYDQLYAYLKQHKAHANENKMMLDGFTQHTVDPHALITSSNTRNQATVQEGRVVVQNVQGRQNKGHGNNARGTSAAGYGGAQNKVGNENPSQARQIKCYNCNSICHIARNCTQPKRPHNLEYFKDKMLLMQAQENRVALDEEQLLFIAADNCDAFDSDVHEASTAQTMFMANLLSADHVHDEASPSYDSDILSEVHDHDHYQDVVCDHHEAHEMHHDVQPNCVVDSNADYMSDSNMIMYDQYVKDNDVLKMKAEALKEQTPASRPIKALTLYPPNTPATLVPRVLPTKIQVKINIFALIQLFLEFKKTCKKRITPTGLTEGKRGFEQTKECYLTKVIPFFKTLKEHFKGIQKVLTKEIKEMKEIFEELEAEVDQNVVNRKYDEIERKNLIIANDNLIANCLSKEVFYIATNYELILKYQNLKESFGNTTSLPARDAPEFDLVFVIDKMKASIQGKDNAIKKLRMQISQLKETRSEADRTLDFRALDFQITQLTEKNVEPIPPRNRNNREVYLDYLKHLKESVETLREIVEEAKVDKPLDRSLASAFLYTKHSQELLEYVIGTCPKDFNRRDEKHATTPLTRKKQVAFEDQCATLNNNTHKYVERLNIQKTNVPVIPSTGVNSCTDASGSQPRRNTKKNRISPAKSVNKKKVEEHPRTNKSSLKTMNNVDSSISSKRVTDLLWYLDSGCSKHMTGDRSRLSNFMKKFIRTVRFGNDHFGAIMGYGDYMIGDSEIHVMFRDTVGVEFILKVLVVKFVPYSRVRLDEVIPLNMLLSKASKTIMVLHRRLTT
ncbi:integrase, catalytic region, zinc finger, CCHC-type containing protein [Tanacetum coccineum]|uniref:Integrase, catalytic region, zinc finger, CCHC-type containing protein n=1 Tax=Tanacetum coccineum TaxID=301880 RepID=A0ABQ5GZG0_9ASTR